MLLRTAEEETQHTLSDRQRRVLTGGLFGSLPGALLIGVPLLLHTLDVISADQSQIGFLGVPLLVIGILAGATRGATASGHSDRVAFGVCAGFVAGLGTGLLVDAALRSVGMMWGGLWLLLVPVGMILGGLLAAGRDSRNRRSDSGIG